MCGFGSEKQIFVCTHGIRVAQAKCLGQRFLGSNIMVYPDNIWYKAVNAEDVSEITEKYLKINETIGERS